MPNYPRTGRSPQQPATTSSSAASPALSWRPDYGANIPAIALTCWWTLFAAISFYWALGGLWLVDTAVGEQGQALARERPGWLIALVTLTGIIKLLPVLFAYLAVAPIGRRIPRRLFLLGGYASGVASLGYGLLATLPAAPFIAEGSLSAAGWVRVTVWMPQFWVGGLLLILTTAVFARRTSARQR